MSLTPPPLDPTETMPDHIDKRAALISRKMTAPEVVSQLIAHQCDDMTNRLNLSTFNDSPVSQGGFSDVYRGYLLGTTRLEVAVKALRISSLDPNPEHLKHAARELHTWSKCRHPNIVPLLGLAVFRGRIGMVSPWMSNGTLPRYLENTPGAHRHSLCVQICEGLAYLHQIGITHGDLKGGNVLVSDQGVPALTDFGNSLLTDATVKLTQREGQMSGPALTLRWSAAELISGDSRHTIASDVYALGMTILEVLSGNLPYHGKSDTTVMFLVVVRKEPPERPEGMSTDHMDMDQVWQLLLRCWSYEPGNRPSAAQVAEAMKNTRVSVRIGRKMPLGEVVKELEFHGCKNVTNLLNLQTFKKLPHSSGGFNHVYIGTLFDGTSVALRYRKLEMDFEERNEIEKVAQEIYTLSKCDHPNVLPLIGLAVYHDQLAMVLPYYRTGPLRWYPMKNSVGVNRFSLLAQVASAVAYLHKHNIVHGHILEANILVSDNRKTKLVGFGSARLSDPTLQFTATTNMLVIPVRWAAPEIIQGNTGPTPEADIYALGMTILQCISDSAPYREIQQNVTVMKKVLEGTHPFRPILSIPNNEHGDRLWTLLTRCWSQDAALRPTADEVERELLVLAAMISTHPTPGKTPKSLALAPGPRPLHLGTGTVPDSILAGPPLPKPVGSAAYGRDDMQLEFDDDLKRLGMPQRGSVKELKGQRRGHASSSSVALGEGVWEQAQRETVEKKRMSLPTIDNTNSAAKAENEKSKLSEAPAKIPTHSTTPQRPVFTPGPRPLDLGTGTAPNSPSRVLSASASESLLKTILARYQ